METTLGVAKAKFETMRDCLNELTEINLAEARCLRTCFRAGRNIIIA